jgi:hypothetical protein
VGLHALHRSSSSSTSIAALQPATDPSTAAPAMAVNTGTGISTEEGSTNHERGRANCTPAAADTMTGSSRGSMCGWSTQEKQLQQHQLLLVKAEITAETRRSSSGRNSI